jgi:hypothetical protein
MCNLCNFMAADPEKLGFCSFTTFNIFIGTKCDNVLYRHRCTKCNLEWDACKQKTAHKTDHNIVLLHKGANEAKLESVSFTGADKDTTTRKDVYACIDPILGPIQRYFLCSHWSLTNAGSTTAGVVASSC